MFDEGMPGEDPNYGWNRASVQYRSRRPYRPAVKAQDLVMPSGLGNARMLRTCFLMAGIITVLYVWIPLMFLSVFVPISGLTYAAVLGGFLLGLTTFLYLAGARETRRDRELAGSDFRAHAPRFSHENLDRNLDLVEALREVADERGATVAQLATAWVLSRGGDIVPLIGARTRERLAESLGALEVELSEEDVARIEAAVPPGAAAGDRYNQQGMATLDSER